MNVSKEFEIVDKMGVDFMFRFNHMKKIVHIIKSKENEIDWGSYLKMPFLKKGSGFRIQFLKRMARDAENLANDIARLRNALDDEQGKPSGIDLHDTQRKFDQVVNVFIGQCMKIQRIVMQKTGMGIEKLNKALELLAKGHEDNEKELEKEEKKLENVAA